MARTMIAGVAAMLAVLLAAASSGAEGRDFHVGGRGGWAPNPDEPFNAWAERNRFQVNDTLGESSWPLPYSRSPLAYLCVRHRRRRVSDD
jgi:hypothetical protein